MTERSRRVSPALALLAFGLLSSAARARDPLPGAGADPLEAVARAYRIEVTTESAFPVRTTYGAIDGKSPDRAARERYVPLFISEFTLYPRELVTRSKLKRVVLCAELSFAGQRRNAVPDFEHDTLYLDAERGAGDRTYLRKVIHHEFFHIIDYRDDGQLYSDAGWAALNPRDFMYGTGGANAQTTSTTSVLTSAVPGFLNHYSTTGVEEDKAEVFANMIVDSAYVEERIKTDRVLASKVERMRALMARFCPDANESFWTAARRVDRADAAPGSKADSCAPESSSCRPACLVDRWRLLRVPHRRLLRCD
ncbi:hypothetical protein J8F10_12020 [Gemmata sp. G18]|uniref:Lipoprotein n=1 Tax=Gemmata palustris TaxID=2822762 RepID=A0ABS5BQM5_9BACT|nr:putative zinc-binding metallopeptidase [Gemmata palustris]MBP3956012.1 hypothetical protein [Gemmata palustris]